MDYPETLEGQPPGSESTKATVTAIPPTSKTRAYLPMLLQSGVTSNTAPPIRYTPVLQAAEAWVRDLLDKGEAVPAVYWIGSATQTDVNIVPIGANNAEEKEHSARAARKVAAMCQADFVLCISEAWGLTRSDAKKMDEIYAKYGSLAAYPGHTDVISFHLETPDGYFNDTAEITFKFPSKKRRVLAPVSLSRPISVVGRLVGILPIAAGGMSVH